MTPERRFNCEILNRPLTQEEILQGYHYCPDWDYMLIGPEDPETECCTCAIDRS